MTYPYTLNFIGITCLVKQQNGYYLAALPDGRNYTDYCSGQKVDPHYPYLLIPMKQMVSSDVAGRIINGCFVVELDGVQSLDFATASTPGTIDDTDTVTNKNGYLWSQIDANFKLRLDAPANTILTIDVKQGTFYARRMMGDPNMYDLAVYTEVRIDRTVPGSFNIIVDGTDNIVVAEGADLVVANVEPEWLINVKADNEKHFNLYYRMVTTAVQCQKPAVKKPTITTSQHPYLTANRGLQIACSSTNYP